MRRCILPLVAGLFKIMDCKELEFLQECHDVGSEKLKCWCQPEGDHVPQEWISHSPDSFLIHLTVQTLAEIMLGQ